MPINDSLRNVTAGAAVLRPDSAEQKRCNRAILMQANYACMEIANGRDWGEVAQNCEDPMSLGIGAMLAKMSKKDLFREPDRVIDLLNGVFVSESPKRIDLNRRTVIETLRISGILPHEMNAQKAKPEGTSPTLAEICTIIELHTGITREQIVSASRVRELVRARFLVIWIMRNECGLSLAQIGVRLGGRDHTTIRHGLRHVKFERDSDMDKRMLIDSIVDQSDLLALKRNHSALKTSMLFRKKGLGSN